MGFLGAGAVVLLAGSAVTGVLSKVAHGLSGTFAGAGVASGFRIYAVTELPTFDPVDWRLNVDGLVEKPLVLTYGEMRQLPNATQFSTFRCVTGWRVNNVQWGGLRIGAILDMVKPKPNAKFITFYSMDGVYIDSLSIPEATSPDVLLAYDMGGQPLSQPHGSPLRVIVPSMFGYKGTKWVHRMELKETQDIGYWEQRGYPADGTIANYRGP